MDLQNNFWDRFLICPSVFSGDLFLSIVAFFRCFYHNRFCIMSRRRRSGTNQTPKERKRKKKKKRSKQPSRPSLKKPWTLTKRPSPLSLKKPWTAPLCALWISNVSLYFISQYFKRKGQLILKLVLRSAGLWSASCDLEMKYVQEFIIEGYRASNPNFFCGICTNARKTRIIQSSFSVAREDQSRLPYNKQCSVFLIISADVLSSSNLLIIL